MSLSLCTCSSLPAGTPFLNLSTQGTPIQPAQSSNHISPPDLQVSDLWDQSLVSCPPAFDPSLMSKFWGSKWSSAKHPFHWVSWCSVTPLCPASDLHGKMCLESSGRIVLVILHCVPQGHPQPFSSCSGPWETALCGLHPRESLALCLLVGFSPLQALTGNLKVSREGEVGVFIFRAPPCIPAVLAVAVFLYLELQLLWSPLQTLAFCLKGGNGLLLAPAGSLALPHILWVISPCQPL